MPRKVYRKRAPAARKPRKYARRVYKKKSTFASRVKKVIHSQIENKHVNTYAGNTALVFALSGGLSPIAIGMLPTVSQGTGQAQRVGNEINVIKANLKGYVNILPYNFTTNPQPCPVYVKMWLCRRKQGSPGITGLPSSADYNQWFQSGSGTIGFQGNMLDMTFDTNKDYWTVLATKTIQLGNNSPTSSSSAILSGNLGVSQPFSFNFAKHIGKLKYNDTFNTPTNKELYLVFQNVLADGSTGNAISATEIHYNIEWTYEDA